MPLLLQHVRVAVHRVSPLIPVASSHQLAFCDVSILSCLSVLFAFICVYVICLAFDATVSFCHFGCVIMFAKQCLH